MMQDEFAELDGDATVCFRPGGCNCADETEEASDLRTRRKLLLSVQSLEFARQVVIGSAVVLSEDILEALSFFEVCGNDRSYLGLLSVQPARQGAGLGRQLVAAAENLARETGSGIMDLRVISARGEQLLPFYERLGYQIIRTEPFPANLVAKVASHYILMSKPLV